MSAPTPAPGDDRPREGYYPDPSIPGYVRYWNGAAWVPGTSRPAPSDGESLPTPQGAPATPAPAPVEETGPVFLDEEPSVRTETGPDEPTPPEPASAWGADAARQTGFGGEQDRRVSWGAQPPAGEQPAAPASQQPAPPAAQQPATPSPQRTDGTVAIRAVRPGADKAPRGDGTMAIRAVPAQGTGSGSGAAPKEQPRPEPRASAAAPAEAPPAADPRAGQPPADPRTAAPAQRPQPAPGPATPPQSGLRPAASAPAPGPAPAPAPSPAPAPANQPGYGYPPQQAQPQSPQPQAQPAYGYPPQQAGPALPTPVTQGPGGGSPSWAQQVHQLAAPEQGAEPEGPVTPFKPVANDPFLAAAQAQAATRPAGLGKRFAARLVDSLVLGAATAAAAVPLGTKAADHIDGKIDAAKASGRQVTVWLLDGTTATYLGIVLAVLIVFGVLYEALPTAKWGHTLGKKLMGLSVQGIEDYDRPTFGAALKRWLAYSVLGVLVIGVLGVLWGLFDRPWRQCLHDKVARTFVAG